MKKILFRSVKELCYIAMGIALYIALSATVKIPLIGHIQTDLGYIVFGMFCVIFGWRAFIVGAAGCVCESLLFSGWFPLGWMLGQIAIGLICGISFKFLQKIDKKWLKYTLEIAITAVAITIGIIGIKTGVECSLYGIPLAVKITKNSIAAAADFVPMIFGVILADTIKDKIHISIELKDTHKAKVANESNS